MTRGSSLGAPTRGESNTTATQFQFRTHQSRLFGRRGVCRVVTPLLHARWHPQAPRVSAAGRRRVAAPASRHQPPYQVVPRVGPCDAALSSGALGHNWIEADRERRQRTNNAPATPIERRPGAWQRGQSVERAQCAWRSGRCIAQHREAGRHTEHKTASTSERRLQVERPTVRLRRGHRIGRSEGDRRSRGRDAPA